MRESTSLRKQRRRENPLKENKKKYFSADISKD